MTDKKFSVGDRVFDDVYLEFGRVNHIMLDNVLVVIFQSPEDYKLYGDDGKYEPTDSRPRLHKTNSEQELQLVLDEIMRKYKEG